MNNAIMFGNITKDAELRTVNVKGIDVAVCDFTVAVNSGRKESQRTEFVRCSIWREYAQKMVGMLLKGRPVVVQGEVHPSYYVRQTDNTVVPQLRMENVTVRFCTGNPGSAEPEPAPDPDPDLPFEN